MDRSINALAEGVKHKSIEAKEMYESGDLKGALEKFKLALRDSHRLIRKKRESVALCRLNLASAQIGGGDETEISEGRKELEQLLEESKQDNSLSACIYLNLALSSKDKDKKTGYLETCLEKLDVTDAKTDTLVLHQKALEETLQLLDAKETKEQYQGNEPPDKQERNYNAKKVEFRTLLADVYKRLSKETDTEMEESETVLDSKRVGNLLALGNMTVAQHKQTARKYADDCLSILAKDWSRVQVNTCSDLAVLFTEIGAFEKAKLCFRKTQLCINELEDQEVICHMLQNLGAVSVLEQKYKEATQYFNDALGVIDGRATERRAHLYLNLGFAWSQLGRGRIWKAYEAYLNAANYAASKELDTEVNLRLDAVQGLVLAGMAVLDYRAGLGDFCVKVVLSHKEFDADATQNWQNIDVAGFKNKMKEEIKDKYMTCIGNVNAVVLDKQCLDEDRR